MNAAKLLLLFAVSITVTAATVTEDFNSRSYFNSTLSTLVWNQALGRLQPTLKVAGWEINAGFPQPDITYSVGDGSHGPFNRSTYANFSVGGDLSNDTIRLDTSLYPELKVTEFTLDAGWTLEPVGDNPLIIRSLSDVTINGIIECSGGDGQPVTNAVSTVALGGQGRCGGGDGGDGGSDTVAPEAGDPSGAGALGGGPGLGEHVVNGGDGGGGGGAYGNGSAGQGTDPSGLNGGLVGNSDDRPAFDDNGATSSEGTGAGAGGGGGFAFTQAGGTSRGGGGGGGGGTVKIYAVRDVTVSATGRVRAYGGAGGGEATGTLKAGGGGGGGGGSILIWAANDINMAANNIVDANFGAGGITLDGTAGNGGVGAIGRTWLSWGNNVTNNERPLYTLWLNGAVVYETGTNQVAVSNAYDLGNTSPRLTGITTSPAPVSGSTISIEAAGSSDNFAADDTGWLPSTSLDALSGKRYVKFRVTLNNAASTTPDAIESLTFEFEGGRRDTFNFVSACGRIGNTNSTGSLNALVLLALLFMIYRYAVPTRSTN
ncbi:MAG TPA: hypothetical protein VFV50_17760 [Bdellovibrionales bacterium]|nr:hypothetical protein [Bdellovibrionales bacterium]